MLYLQLLVVGYMLVMTASTDAEMLAGGLNPRRGWLENFYQLTTSVLLFVGNDADFNFFPRYAKGNKDRPAVGQATDGITTICWIFQGNFEDL